MPDGGAVEDAGETLERAAQARREAEGLRVRLDAAARHADETAKRVQEARDRLEDESEDVDRLESMSWSRIASAVRGRRSTDLERERAEREAARYQVAHAEALTAQEWSSSDPDLVHRLAVVAERRGALLAEDREAREAHAAGLAARNLLLEARRTLGSAGSWATWDTFGGGGLLTDMVKYDRLDRVAALLREADGALTAFSRELADLDLGGVGGVQVDGLTRTFDIFFDNVFSDWAVRSRIREAEVRVAQTLVSVEALLQELTLRGLRYADELAGLEREREGLLLGRASQPG
jgi:hypothetical protein